MFPLESNMNQNAHQQKRLKEQTNSHSQYKESLDYHNGNSIVILEEP